MDIVKANINTEELTRQDEAKALHYEILRNGADAAAAMVSLAANLKNMRDKKLYEELGYDSFENYTTEAVGLKKSQAYDYISALERLGDQELQRAAARGLGITKIKMLCAFNPIDRAEFIKNNDVGEMSTRELKQKIDELTYQGEQLSLELGAAEEDKRGADERIEELEEEKAQLKKQIEELRNKPTEVAVREPNDEEKQAMVKDAVSEATKDLTEQIKKLKKEKTAADKQLKENDKKAKETLSAEKKKAADEAVKKYKEENAVLSAEIEKAKQKAKELERQIQVSSSPEITKFSFYFDIIRENTAKMFDALVNISDTELKEKLKSNLSRYAETLKALAED